MLELIKKMAPVLIALSALAVLLVSVFDSGLNLIAGSADLTPRIVRFASCTLAAATLGILVRVSTGYQPAGNQHRVGCEEKT